ncbi:PA0069 family radical SAM protein [Fulvivirga sp. RKSG066]|uniref:PA0069 family radical SAM protein n=1 Tax=Fulvivirga aurantia TaxID=2529383 RepID=UPI001625CF78|nr:PA0069 family radical SAM protein [Fulvivirga aurantia]
MEGEEYHKGRGAQIKTDNPFFKQRHTLDIPEAVDEDPTLDRPKTQILFEYPKNVVNKVDSVDVGMDFSLNPYQGCEHGCIYCYARNSHEYWGHDAGLGFETKIIVKKNAPQLLEQKLLSKNWRPHPIVLSGNTDCYQPLEKKFKLTRQLLQVFNKYKHPVGIITKNTLVLRDIDLLEELAKDNLVRVIFSITTLDEKLRSVMEPRTASAAKKLKAIKTLTERGISVSIMNAPIIPGLNHHEIPAVIKAAAEHGAVSAGYTIVRLNGSIGTIFEDWLRKNFPDRFDKVWNQIREAHGGKVNDSRFGTRMRGEGKLMESINQLFNASKKKYLGNRQSPTLDTSKFRRNGNYQLF